MDLFSSPLERGCVGLRSGGVCFYAMVKNTPLPPAYRQAGSQEGNQTALSRFFRTSHP